MTRPAAPTDSFAAYESSGRWDRPLGPLAKSVDRLQKARIHSIPVSVGIHTEMDRDQLEAAFTHQPGNWRHVRLDATDAAQIIATYDHDVWEVAKARALVLSTIKVHTQKGFLLPQPTMLEVALDHHATGGRLYLEGMHWPLQNTKNRVAATHEVEHRLVGHWRAIERRDPHAAVLHLADTNRDVRTGERAALLHMLGGAPGFAQSWDLHGLPADGTHDRSVIDNGLTNLPIRRGGAVLLPDDPSSDHRPMGCCYALPPAKGDHPALVVPVTTAVRSYPIPA